MLESRVALAARGQRVQAGQAGRVGWARSKICKEVMRHRQPVGSRRYARSIGPQSRIRYSDSLLGVPGGQVAKVCLVPPGYMAAVKADVQGMAWTGLF